MKIVVGKFKDMYYKLLQKLGSEDLIIKMQLVVM